MYKIFVFLLFISILLMSCKEDLINVPKAGESPFSFSKARIELISDGTTNIGYITINQLGYVICDSIRISYSNFNKEYSFIGNIKTDSSISIILTPKDSAANDKLIFNAKQTGINTAGSLLYCEDKNNCSLVEIGHIIGYFTNRFEGFYYSPLFLGEYYVYPL